MDTQKLIGMRVFNNNTHAIGIIEYVREGIVAVDHHGKICKYPYPAAFAGLLELEDEVAQRKIQNEGMEASFEYFKRDYRFAINNEIDFLKTTGGKKYRIVDGEKLPSKNGEYLYAFDTDTDLHFPDGTAIKLWFPDNIVPAYVVSCEDFTILIRSIEYIGEIIESVEFTSEQWLLLEALMERLDEMDPSVESLAYDIACNGKRQIKELDRIRCGQNIALNRATSEGISFIWGPPGTGKTETLANIALEHMENDRRVLMLSYSNVSVDGALLRVAKKADLPKGAVIRYGYPRTKELLESKTLTSYQYVLHKNPEKATQYHELSEQKKKLRRKDAERIEINNNLNKIRKYFVEEERELVQQALFVATTVSKATVDKAIYMQNFDVVIFDEASMAYVPQVVFAAGLARKHFVCLGDFFQLPAIVQNSAEERLTRDIFEYTGITSAVSNNQGHDWLVMLDVQYRMHQDIAEFISAQMYQGRLKTSERIADSRIEIAACGPCPNSAISMVDLSGMYSVCTKTMDGSRINVLSALMCLRLAEKSISEYEVGIITPYSAQSRLILAMVRDIQEVDKRWLKVSCATVHQFQGSEKPVIIYDAVDCFRMAYPGLLLTSMKNDTANRLFNVAVTRAKGKFILVANKDYLERKKISPKLIFTQAMKKVRRDAHSIEGYQVLDEMMPVKNEKPLVYVEDREVSWDFFIAEIGAAKKSIYIDLPDVIDDNDAAINQVTEILAKKEVEGLEIRIRLPEDVILPERLQKYAKIFGYITNPISCTEHAQTYQCKDGDRVLMEILDTRGIAESEALNSDVSAEEMLIDEVNKFSPDVAIFMLNCTHRDDVNSDVEFLKRVTKSYADTNSMRLPVVVVVNKADDMAPSRYKNPEEYPMNKVDKINEVVRYYKEIIVKNGLKIDNIIAVSSLIDWQTPDGMEIAVEEIGNLPKQDIDNLGIAFDGRYKIEELLDILEEAILDFEAQMGLRMAARLTEVVHRLARHLNKIFSGISGTVALTPIPVSDIYILLVIQVVLVTLIASLSGRDISLDTAKEFILSMGGVAGLGYSFKVLAQQGAKILNFLWAGAGSAVSATVATLGTAAIGNAAISYYIDGKSIENAKKAYVEAKKE